MDSEKGRVSVVSEDELVEGVVTFRVDFCTSLKEFGDRRAMIASLYKRLGQILEMGGSAAEGAVMVSRADGLYSMDWLTDEFPDGEFLKADGFDGALIGVDIESMRLVYSVSRCVKILIDQGMSEEDALDYFYYNVSGSYVGEKTPIWVEHHQELF